MLWFYFFLGLILLVGGAEVLIRGASKLAALAGISPLVIGLTVVAYGTSAPEMAVSVSSALQGQADIAIGNVVGSNLFNVLFILGICALILPLKVVAQLIRLDVPIMVGACLAMYLFSLDGLITRGEAAVLFLAGVVYTAFIVWQSRRETKAVQQEYEQEYGDKEKPTIVAISRDLMFVIAGLVLLVQGSDLLVDSAIELARSFGISELIISLTIVAAGTSLPEVATSVIAALRGERDIAIGNVVGSSIFNILAVLAATGIVAPQGVAVSAEVIAQDLPVMLAVAIACLPVFYTHAEISRWEGALFLFYYVLYTAHLIVQATGAEVPEFVSTLVIYGVFPATVLGLGFQSFRCMREATQ